MPSDKKELVATDPDIPLRPVTDLSELPEAEQERIMEYAGGDADVRAVTYTDLLVSGRYGVTSLILTDEHLIVVESGQLQRRVALAEMESAHCRDFVGNGVLTVHTCGDKLVDLARYSRTLSEAVSGFAKHLNNTLGVSDERLEEKEEAVAKVSGPREEGTYRCPNCGHPLQSPTESCSNCASRGRIFLRLLGFMKAHKALAVGGALLSIVGTALQLAPGFLMKYLVDYSLNVPGVEVADRLRALYVFVGAFLCVIALRFVVQRHRIRIMGLLGERVVFDLRQGLYRALQRLSLSYFDKEHTGRIMARVLNDTRGIQGFIVQGLQHSLIYTLLVIAIPLVLFLTNWKLACVALLPIPIVAVAGKIFAGRFKTIYRTVRRRFATMAAAVSDTISGVRVVKSFAQEDREVDDFHEKGNAHYLAHVAAIEARSIFNPVVILLMGVGTMAVWLFGGTLVVKGGITLGTLFLFFSYMNMLYNPVQQLVQLTEVFQNSATAAERIFNIMDMPSDVADHDQGMELTDIAGRIAFEDVSFGYEDGERVLKKIDFTIQPGQMIGLVGQTGSGKSTFVSLVCRFYDPTKGRLTLDGVDLRDIKVKSLRQQIGMVLQDTFLFAGTLRDNIAYGKPDASDAEIVQAAKAANAHDFIVALPDGYDTEVGERGVGLSGGEKQRVSIARAILKNPAILILDEATSAVDTATEVSIQQAMDRLVKGRTTIAIAHRLSTLRNADKLLVMDDGEIIEQGSHEELIARDGEYAKLCKIQADFAKEVVPA